jgi:Chaperone for flagella basal body P-ring formation
MMYCSRAAYCLSWLAVIALQTAPLARAACYSTPAAALGSMHQETFVSTPSDGSGYRITGIQSDPILGQRWALIANCNHPEWPIVALAIRRQPDTAQSHTESSPLAPVIHIGDTVRLWRQEEFLRIETAGIAEENGYPGKTIRVRLLHRSEDEPFSQQQIAGIVRGPADVEMQP